MMRLRGWSIFLKNGVVYIPTNARTDGPRLLTVPVAIIPLANTDGVVATIVSRMLEPEITMPNPYARGVTPISSPVLQAVGARSWPEFEKGAHYWSIEGDEKGFRIYPEKRDRRGRSGGFDIERSVTMPPDATPNDVAQKMVALLRAAADEVDRGT